MARLLLTILNVFVSLSLFAQVSKSNTAPDSLIQGPGHFDKTFVYDTCDFTGCTSLTEVELDLNLGLGNGSICGAGPQGIHDELNVRLVSPEGTSVDLVMDKDGYWNGFTPQTPSLQSATYPSASGNINFDDDHGTNVSTILEWQAGNFAPHNSLSAFDGENPKGTWTLQISDGNATQSPLDKICFNSATLHVTCPALSEPDVPTLSIAPGIYCPGDDVPISIVGNLNNAHQWKFYAGSCGLIPMDSTTSDTLVFSETTSMQLFARGEGGCSTPGACSSIWVNYMSSDDPAFNYISTEVCVSDTLNSAPSFIASPGGTFSTSAGLVWNDSITGEIDFNSTIIAGYVIKYVTSGICPDSMTQFLQINPLDDVSFNYASSSYCADGSDPTPSITGTPGGTFNSTAGLSINSLTGTIDLDASTPNSFSVSYTAFWRCENTSVEMVDIILLDTSVNVSGLDLTSNEAGATYQWLDCGNGHSTIGGANAQMYSAGTNGTYAVQIMNNGCIDTSYCFNITTVGVSDFMNQEISIYPNPADQFLNIDLGNLTGNTVRVTNVSGVVVYETDDVSGSFTVDLGNHSGLLLIEISNDGLTRFYKISRQ